MRTKNAVKGHSLYYARIWQELMIEESEGLFARVKSILARFV